MLKLNYGIFSLLLILLKSILCSDITTSHVIFLSEEYLRMILAFLTKDLNVREVSSVFKASFDSVCRFEVISLDPRYSTLTMIPPPLKIPVQIPLLYLLNFVGKDFIRASSVVLNDVYPRVQDEEINKRNNFDRFADTLTAFIDGHFYNPLVPESQKWSPEKLYNFYRLLQLSLPGKDFTTEILPSLKFPLIELLKYAAAGEFPDPINQNLLTEYREFIYPRSGLIFVAFKSSRLDLVRILLTSSKDGHKFKNLLDNESRSILHYAASSGNLDLVISCLLDFGCNINKIDSKREKAIHKAAAKGHLHVVNYFYQYGVPINSVSYYPSPIFKAVENNHYNVVNFILHETNFSSNDQSEYTLKSNFKLFLLAIKRTNYEMVSLLLSSTKLSFDKNMIWKLIEVAGKVENIDYRIERFLESLLF